MQTPPPELHFRRHHAEELKRLKRLKDRTVFCSAGIAGVAALLLFLAATLKTTRAGCSLGVTRFYVVNPHGDDAAAAFSSDWGAGAAAASKTRRPTGSSDSSAFAEGGLRHTARALQLALGLPFVDETGAIPIVDDPVAIDALARDELAEPEDRFLASKVAETLRRTGQWWRRANSHKYILDTRAGTLDAEQLTLVVDASQNVTLLGRVVEPDCDDISAALDVLDPSTSDDDDVLLAPLLWRPAPLASAASRASRVARALALSTTLATAEIRSAPAKEGRRATRDQLHNLGHVKVLFPGLRRQMQKHAPSSVLIKTVRGFVSTLVMTDGVVEAEVHVVSTIPLPLGFLESVGGSRNHRPDAAAAASIRAVVVALRLPERQRTRETDQQLWRVSRVLQEQLSRALLPLDEVQSSFAALLPLVW